MAEPETTPAVPDRTRTVTGGTLAALAVIGVLAIGWFALSHWVMHTAVGDALGEAIGVAFGLLVVVAVIGAVVHREGPEEAGSRPEGD